MPATRKASRRSGAEAIALFDTEWWKSATDEQIARFQLDQDKLCCPFDEFQMSLERALGRPVWTHELGLNRDGLRAELNGQTEPPSFEDIVNLIPEEKRVVIVARDPIPSEKES